MTVTLDYDLLMLADLDLDVGDLTLALHMNLWPVPGKPGGLPLSPTEAAALAAKLLTDTSVLKGALYAGPSWHPEGFCLVGALWHVQGRPSRWAIPGGWIGILGETLARVEAIVTEQYPDRTGDANPGMRAVEFNNHPATTPGEVIAVLEKAAAG